ncbi:MAG: hypothetical protein QOE49_2745, partial [Rhodospirillaceae bacterium]|nr:hypothetical protein [Rhodospirillaceae bacterium]
MRLQPLSDGEFNGGSRQRVVHQTKITLWNGVTRPLEANVDIRPDQYGARFNKVPLKAWKQLAERTLSPDQQSVSMSRLWRTRPVNWTIGKWVALKYDDLFKMIRQCPGRS